MAEEKARMGQQILPNKHVKMRVAMRLETAGHITT